MDVEKAVIKPFDQEDKERAHRLYEEWLNVEQALDQADILKTIVFFGSARTLSPEAASLNFESAKTAYNNALTYRPNDEVAIESHKFQLKQAKNALKQSHFYGSARNLTFQIAQHINQCNDTETRLVTGGGPGIMEAANRGASDAGQSSIGLNIEIPKEQKPNPYIPKSLTFHFRYFSLRKMHFIKRAKAIIVFPGGFGTLDELLEILTLIQTKKVAPIPILLFGSKFWHKTINFKHLAAQQLVSTEDLDLFQTVDSESEALEKIKHCLKCEI